MRLWEIMTDDADEVDGLGENAGGQGGVGCGTTEEVFLRVLRGFDIIQGDGSGDGD